MAEHEGQQEQPQLQGSQPQAAEHITSVQSVDHHDGTFSLVITYAGEQGMQAHPPDGRQRLDFSTKAERDAAYDEWRQKVHGGESAGPETETRTLDAPDQPPSPEDDHACDAEASGR